MLASQSTVILIGDDVMGYTEDRLVISGSLMAFFVTFSRGFDNKVVFMTLQGQMLLMIGLMTMPSLILPSVLLLHRINDVFANLKLEFL